MIKLLTINIPSSFSIILLFTLLGCEDTTPGTSATGEPSSGAQPINIPPVVNAGMDKTYNEKEIAVLNGESSDLDGTIISRSWTQLAGANVDLNNDEFNQAWFVVPPVEETKVLTFELSVIDNLAAKSSSVVRITVVPDNGPPVVNEPPLVDAGSDFEKDEGSTVVLSGQVSSTGGKVILTTWKQVEGISVNLSDALIINPTFIAPELTFKDGAQLLAFELTAIDDLGGVSTDSISVIINPVNEAPIIKIGESFEIDEGSTVTLSGEVSDADGEVLSASWKQLEGKSVELNNDLAVNTTFIAPELSFEEGSQILVFELRVIDNLFAVSTELISITINPVNEPPIAKAGKDRITVPNSEVTLDCSQSYDPEGLELSVSWLQVSGKTIELDDTSSCSITFELPSTDDVFEFSLIVTDDKGESSNDSISIRSTTLPLLTLDNFEYQGGFRLSTQKAGESRLSTLDFAPGIIEFNPANQSLFTVSHVQEQGIGEFKIPEIINSRNIADFKIGTEVLQNFSDFHETERVDTGIAASFRITGLALVDSKLIVNYFNWYDANGKEDSTSIVFQDTGNLAESPIVGPFKMEGAAHAAGWLTPIPAEWQGTLGGTYVGGFSAGSINSRLSVGPSAFVQTPEDNFVVATEGGPVETQALLDFPLGTLLYDRSIYGTNYSKITSDKITNSKWNISTDFILYNEKLNGDDTARPNNLWTIKSTATYGLIIPNTNTYLTLGRSGGHKSGVFYKDNDKNDIVCAGSCTYDPSDMYNYYWLWQVSDLVKVKEGTLLPHQVRPYAHGKFDIPDTVGDGTEVYPLKSETFPSITSGTFDPTNNLLYLAVREGDTVGTYSRPPVYFTYKVTVPPEKK